VERWLPDESNATDTGAHFALTDPWRNLLGVPNLLALSFEGDLSPAFDLRCLHPGATRPDGWGLGFYPPGEPAVTVLKEPAPTHASSQAELVKRSEHGESSIFVFHVRTALWGALSDANTQPFARAWGGREWLFAHSGSLDRRPELSPDPLFEPVGATDSEVIFCDLLNRLAGRRWRSLGEADPNVLAEWLVGINGLGTLNVVLTDGRDLLAYSDKRESGLSAWHLLPPYSDVFIGDKDVEVHLTRNGAKSRKAVVISSRPLTVSGDSQASEWRPLEAGSLWMIRQGVQRVEVRPPGPAPAREDPLRTPGRLNRPTKGEVKRLDVFHRTIYRYAEPVERSMHVFRLIPMHDRTQTVLQHSLGVSVEGQMREYDDAFGNRVRRLRVNKPFTEMVIEARSRVELLDTDPLAFRPLRARSSFPLVWMPWQRNQLAPFLLPPELPESELTDLTDYAMSFVLRNDYDLFDTLLDVNATIYREYRYLLGSTTLATTPFQVYASRRGVCQDFSNLFICLMRLLGVPARYMSGYVYTGPKNVSHPQSEASHAWVQVYLPEVGWCGFDPTNGILTQTDHIRVACGRIYSDATPTSGTIFVGGGDESLEIKVRVEICD
jgi:transglutaminase-like putative cysteine protease/predicted glutamine amidotransferase